MTSLAPPVVILVRPQMGENIGAAARAMANFGLNELRLVAPRDGWPNEKAVAAASRADHVIRDTRVFETVAEKVEIGVALLEESEAERVDVSEVGEGVSFVETGDF